MTLEPWTKLAGGGKKKKESDKKEEKKNIVWEVLQDARCTVCSVQLGSGEVSHYAHFERDA